MSTAPFRLWLLCVVGGLAIASAGCTRVGRDESLLDVEYQYHRVGNRKATVEELGEMQRREELHITELRGDIDRLEQRERELATEHEEKEATLRLLLKDVEVARHEVDTYKAEVETALARSTSLAQQRADLTTKIAKLQSEVSALKDLLARVDQELLPDKARLGELLERVDKELKQAPAAPAESKPGEAKDGQ